MGRPKKIGPKLTDPGTEVIALPASVKARLDMLKRNGEPYYSVVDRLMTLYEDALRYAGDLTDGNGEEEIK